MENSDKSSPYDSADEPASGYSATAHSDMDRHSALTSDEPQPLRHSTNDQRKESPSSTAYKRTLRPKLPSAATERSEARMLSLWLVIPILILGIVFLAAGIVLQMNYGEYWYILLLKEAGAVLMVVAVIHAMYEIVIHKVLHGDIVRLGITVEALQRTVSIVGGAVESGLAPVYKLRLKFSSLPA